MPCTRSSNWATAPNERLRIPAGAAGPASRNSSGGPPGRRYDAGMADGYDPQAIEARWQRRWREQGAYQVDNDAIRTGAHPRPFTDGNIEQLRGSIQRVGAVYDWRREVSSHDPGFMRW